MKASGKKFNKNQSALKDLYDYFSVNDPGELQELYMTEDQKLMKAVQWDYNNPKLVTNKIKNMIEEVEISNIPDKKEKQWIQNILWMWYHHAISCALWKYGDKKAAVRYSETALNLQSNDHPNKITKLLYLLVRSDLKGAKKWEVSITEEPEKTAARHLVGLYKSGNFFKPQV